MESGSIEVMIGQLDGRLEGIGREIGEIKTILTCKSEDCKACKKELDEQDQMINAKVEDLSSKHVGERAVEKWFDNTLVRIGVIVGATCGVIGLVWNIIH